MKVGAGMSIGSRIKELRELNGISRNEFASMLGVTVGAISNYENDVSSPKEPILFKIIESLNCDANYIFQDSVKIKTQQNDVTLAEYEHIKKYRDLDEHGKEMVDFTLEKEYERSIAEKKNSDNIVSMTVKETSAYEVNAAHAIEDTSDEDKAYDEDIMDDENF
jgi:transcriptional regulator with XRE-family HTH domain